MDEVIISAPPMALRLDQVNAKQIAEYTKQLNIFLYNLWQRTGGYVSNIEENNFNTSATQTIDANPHDLLQYTLKANTLNKVNEYVDIEGFGTFAANSNNKRLQLYFGTFLIFDSTSLSLNSGSWDIKAKVIWASSSSQKVIVTVTSSNTNLPAKSFYTLTAASTVNNIVIRFVGTGMQQGDITQEALLIQID